MLAAVAQIPNHLRILVKHHELLRVLVARQLYARYRQSALGMTWVFLRPIASLLVYTIVFSYIGRFPSDELPYPLFLFSALLPWTLLSSGLAAGVPSLTNQANLVSKIYFPREIIPLAAIGGSLFDFAIAVGIFIALVLFYDVGLTWSAVYVVPILAIEVMLIVGLVLLLAMANVWYRDVGHAVALLVQFWMYLTPIVYPYSLVPERILWVYNLNPMVGIIEGIRAVLIKGTPPDLSLLTNSLVISSILLVVGVSWFKRREFDFADVI